MVCCAIVDISVRIVVVYICVVVVVAGVADVVAVVVAGVADVVAVVGFRYMFVMLIAVRVVGVVFVFVVDVCVVAVFIVAAVAAILVIFGLVYIDRIRKYSRVILGPEIIYIHHTTAHPHSPTTHHCPFPT